MHTNCLLFSALAYTLFTPVNALDIPPLRKKAFGMAHTLFTPVNTLDIPSLRKKSFGMASGSEQTMREGVKNHNKVGPAARALRWCLAAQFEEIPDEPWHVRLERVIRFTQQNHNEIGPVARAARWCLAAQFEEIPDEPWAERRERVRRFTQQGEQQCRKKLKKSLEEQAAGQKIDKEVLGTEINRVKDEWDATFDELTSCSFDSTATTLSWPSPATSGDEDTAMPEFPVPKAKPQVVQLVSKAKPRVHPQWQRSHGASSGGTGWAPALASPVVRASRKQFFEHLQGAVAALSKLALAASAGAVQCLWEAIANCASWPGAEHGQWLTWSHKCDPRIGRGYVVVLVAARSSLVWVVVRDWD